MKSFSFNWKFGLALVVCIVAGLLGRYSANYSFQKEKEALSKSNKELLVDSDSITPLEKEPVVKQSKTRKVNIITIKKQYQIQAAVFRPVEGYYKDVHRKETIRPVLLSNGHIVLKQYMNDQFCPYGFEELTSIPGYEYQITDVVNGHLIIYAYNENDKK